MALKEILPGTRFEDLSKKIYFVMKGSFKGTFPIPFAKVFLLWLKEARIILNISFSLLTFTGGVVYLFNLITADPTLGLGIKQSGET